MDHHVDILGCMCIMCDGASRDEVLFDVHGAIDRHGWYGCAVEPHPPELGWAYTIGLASRGHPEFLVVDPPPDIARILQTLADSVLETGEIYQHMETGRIGAYRARFRRVHASHLGGGLIALWEDYYECTGESVEGEVLQVVLDVDGACPDCQTAVPRLDDPDVDPLRSPRQVRSESERLADARRRRARTRQRAARKRRRG
jgi:hypothetical protein